MVSGQERTEWDVAASAVDASSVSEWVTQEDTRPADEGNYVLPASNSFLISDLWDYSFSADGQDLDSVRSFWPHFYAPLCALALAPLGLARWV